MIQSGGCPAIPELPVEDDVMPLPLPAEPWAYGVSALAEIWLLCEEMKASIELSQVSPRLLDSPSACWCIVQACAGSAVATWPADTMASVRSVFEFGKQTVKRIVIVLASIPFIYCGAQPFELRFIQPFLISQRPQSCSKHLAAVCVPTLETCASTKWSSSSVRLMLRVGTNYSASQRTDFGILPSLAKIGAPEPTTRR